MKLAISPALEIHLPILETTTSTKRKADEIADSEEEGIELGSDDDFGLPDDDDIFNEAVLHDSNHDQSGRDELE